MMRLYVGINTLVLSLSTALHAFDARLAALRAGTLVMPDSLVHYNMLLAWWRHGDSPRGFTLTPSPYFIDMLVEFPLMLLAPDFEQWSYALACAYAVLIFTALYLVVRIVLEFPTVLAAAVTGLTMVGFYKLAPFDFVMHTFVVNHTSELFTTLGLIALLHGWFRPGARSRRYAPYVYVALVAICVASSPFFIATYCIPVALAATAIVGTAYMSRRRLAQFVGLTALGSVSGLLALAILARYAWPVRGDYYGDAWTAFKTFKHSLYVEPGGWRAGWATLLAMIASVALAFIGRRTRRWAIPTVFLLAFFPACALACVVLPLKRGAFGGPYEFRYITLPWLLTLAFYVTTATRLASVCGRPMMRRLPRIAVPRMLPWAAAVLTLAAFAIAATCRGSLTMDDEGSLTSSTLRCVRDAERHGGIEDGLSTWQLARYVNAARYAADWGSPYVVVQLLPLDHATVDPRDNNLTWFEGRYRGGATKLNFLITAAMSDAALAFFREHIGAPDRTITCPSPTSGSFALWVWDRDDAQHRLADFVTHDNLRSPFSPVIGATRMAIDVEWGMSADPRSSRLVARRRIWSRDENPAGAVVAEINPMFLPSGRYRLEVDLAAEAPSGSTDPVGELRVLQDGTGVVGRRIVVGGDNQPSMEFEIVNRGGPTSGASEVIDVIAGTATSIAVAGATLTLLDERGISPFQIFR
jgi:hypothetical protein